MYHTEEQTMKVKAPTIVWLLFYSLLLFPTANCEKQLEYTIEVGLDGLAKWTIQCPDLLQPFETFIDNVESLVSEAIMKTGRNMSASKYSMITNVSGSYTLVIYQFHWISFAANETGRMRIGDVFEVTGLFLFGEGIVNIVYPEDYGVENVVPENHDAPNAYTLTWWGIADFKSGEPRITLIKKEPISLLELFQQDTFLLIGIIIIVAVGSSSFYYVKTKKSIREVKKKEPMGLVETIEVEGDEERILNLLKAAGGRLHQTAIANQFRFSKAKTSILLSKMEERGRVKRIEKGRKKIVILITKEEKKSADSEI